MRCRHHDSVSYHFKGLTWDLHRLVSNLLEHWICNYYWETYSSSFMPMCPWNCILSKGAQELREANAWNYLHALPITVWGTWDRKASLGTTSQQVLLNILLYIFFQLLQPASAWKKASEWVITSNPPVPWNTFTLLTLPLFWIISKYSEAIR